MFLLENSCCPSFHYIVLPAGFSVLLKYTVVWIRPVPFEFLLGSDMYVCYTSKHHCVTFHRVWQCWVTFQRVWQCCVTFQRVWQLVVCHILVGTLQLSQLNLTGFLFYNVTVLQKSIICSLPSCLAKLYIKIWI